MRFKNKNVSSTDRLQSYSMIVLINNSFWCKWLFLLPLMRFVASKEHDGVACIDRMCASARSTCFRLTRFTVGTGSSRSMTIPPHHHIHRCSCRTSLEGFSYNTCNICSLLSGCNILQNIEYTYSGWQPDLSRASCVTDTSHFFQWLKQKSVSKLLTLDNLDLL